MPRRDGPRRTGTGDARASPRRRADRSSTSLPAEDSAPPAAAAHPSAPRGPAGPIAPGAGAAAATVVAVILRARRTVRAGRPIAIELARRRLIGPLNVVPPAIVVLLPS